MANFVAFQSVNIDDSFLGEFIRASLVPVDNVVAASDSQSTQTTTEARQIIESYFAVTDGAPARR